MAIPKEKYVCVGKKKPFSYRFLKMEENKVLRFRRIRAVTLEGADDSDAIGTGIKNKNNS